MVQIDARGRENTHVTTLKHPVTFPIVIYLEMDREICQFSEVVGLFMSESSAPGSSSGGQLIGALRHSVRYCQEANPSTAWVTHTLQFQKSIASRTTTITD